jgi:hypothetical protein
MILPGVYINEHAEGLIAPGQITIGNLGVVGTAAKGAVGTPILLGSLDDARKEFFQYDPWLNAQNLPHEDTALTLLRALEQAFGFGATVVYAVRVTDGTEKAATVTLKAEQNETIVLTANTPGSDSQPGTWGNHLSVDVLKPDNNLQAFIQEEIVPTKAPPFKLRRPIDKTSPRNVLTIDDNGIVTSPSIVYDKPPAAGEVSIGTVGPKLGVLTFPAGESPKPTAVLTASYMAQPPAQQVTVHLDRATETYIAHDAADLVSHLVNESAWISGDVNVNVPGSNPKNNSSIKLLLPVTGAALTGGTDGAKNANYQTGLDQLLTVDAHIIVAAGQNLNTIGPALERHCATASTDALKRERIAIVGSDLIDPAHPDNPDQAAIDKFFDLLISHNLSSDRLILVAPGMRAIDSADLQRGDVTLPGSYSAAALAGLISSFDPEVSPTNKELAVDELEIHFDAAHLTQMVQAHILALEARNGFRIVKGITTDPGAFRQITARRIVDYARFGVRGAAEPYIGLLNNDRVRGALRATINSFLTDMVNAEMLESYDLDVSATRDEELQGIARVKMSLQPVFSIDFIVVDMFLG